MSIVIGLLAWAIAVVLIMAVLAAHGAREKRAEVVARE